jgi:hypothetical protein
MRSSLVFKYSCAQCASAYVNMASRNFYPRLAEHKGRSFGTGTLLAHPSHSDVRVHAKQCNVPVSDSDFSVLAPTTGVSDLRI